MYSVYIDPFTCIEHTTNTRSFPIISHALPIHLLYFHDVNLLLSWSIHSTVNLPGQSHPKVSSRNLLIFLSNTTTTFYPFSIYHRAHPINPALLPCSASSKKKVVTHLKPPFAHNQNTLAIVNKIQLPRATAPKITLAKRKLGRVLVREENARETPMLQNQCCFVYRLRRMLCS